jgi:hypothetical protein
MAMVLVVLPAWVDFWWRQRHWASSGWILAGGPVLVLLAVALGVLAWRRGERGGRLATIVAVILPAAVFLGMNFAGNP